MLGESSYMLQIIYFNIRSLLPKISELQLLCLTENPDVVCVTDVDVDDRNSWLLVMSS